MVQCIEFKEVELVGGCISFREVELMEGGGGIRLRYTGPPSEFD